MNYQKKEISYPSSDGKNTVRATVYAPIGEVRGVVQLAHGMIDYVGRYEAVAEFLTGHGFVFAGNDHLGHGRTAASSEDFGFFAERDGYNRVIEDVKKMNDLLREEYPDLPIVLLGHSMGSFVARIYATRYPDSISALIIHGTGGKNPAAPLGKALVSLLKVFFGARHRSKFITAVAFGSYNSKFDKSEGQNAWLTRDVARVASRDSDPYTSYIFTLAGYHDLFVLLSECNSKSWYEAFPKDLPTLVISGDADPVGNYGKGTLEVHSGLLSAGVKKLTLKMYEGARHELFNEYNSDEVFSDLLQWIEAAIS